jgi:hypothetical protein
VDGQAQSWTEALKDYDSTEAWEALKQFRSEEEREFAPNISNLIGRMDTLRLVKKQHEDNQLLLAPPKNLRQEYEPMETYAYPTSRTTPKRNKDEPDHEIRKAVRVSPQRRRDIEQERIKAGFRRVSISLGSRSGFEWVKP